MIINYFQTKINEEKYSLSTLSTIRYVLKSILEYAQSKYAIKCPNFNFIKLAKKKSDCKVLTSDQIMLLGKYSFNHFEPISLAILLSLYGGLRIGEFSGLKWKDIDFDNDLIRVERTVERLKAPANSATKTQLMLMDPKTATSKRIIPIPSFVMEYVKNIINIMLLMMNILSILIVKIFLILEVFNMVFIVFVNYIILNQIFIL